MKIMVVNHLFLTSLNEYILSSKGLTDDEKSKVYRASLIHKYFDALNRNNETSAPYEHRFINEKPEELDREKLRRFLCEEEKILNLFDYDAFLKNRKKVDKEDAERIEFTVKSWSIFAKEHYPKSYKSAQYDFPLFAKYPPITIQRICCFSNDAEFDNLIQRLTDIPIQRIDAHLCHKIIEVYSGRGLTPREVELLRPK